MVLAGKHSRPPTRSRQPRHPYQDGGIAASLAAVGGLYLATRSVVVTVIGVVMVIVLAAMALARRG